MTRTIPGRARLRLLAWSIADDWWWLHWRGRSAADRTCPGLWCLSFPQMPGPISARYGVSPALPRSP